MSTEARSETEIIAEIERVGARLRGVREAARSVIFGQETVIDRSLITLLAGGHGLLIGVPGLAKTLLVETLGSVLGVDAKRIQFTPDLMPSDIIGSEVLEEVDGDAGGPKRVFRFIKGPIFTQLLMADEINRASPKTQSALLQAMQERHVSVAGHRYDVPTPFHVLATQNPLEQEGTYPLPEAQLDRFLLQIDVDYPDEDAERQMLYATTGVKTNTLSAMFSGEDLIAAQQLVRQMPVPDSVVDAILKVVRAARPGPTGAQEINDTIAWGPGPRASQALMLAVRAQAMLDNRLAPSIDDVVLLADPVLKHRMALTFSARADGKTIEGAIASLTETLE